jgi:hypothetical protein
MPLNRRLRAAGFAVLQPGLPPVLPPVCSPLRYVTRNGLHTGSEQRRRAIRRHPRANRRRRGELLARFAGHALEREALRWR